MPTPAQQRYLKARFRARARRTSAAIVPPQPPPRYDAVFVAGTAWLDSLESEPRADEDEQPELLRE